MMFPTVSSEKDKAFLVCPKCGGDKVTKTSGAIDIVEGDRGAGAFVRRIVFNCERCKHTWKGGGKLI